MRLTSSVCLKNTGHRTARVRVAHCFWLQLTLLSLLFFNPLARAWAQDYQVVHCLLGCPEGVDPDNQLILRSSYALSYNERRKSADWVAYRVIADAVGIASGLSREPLPDAFELDTLQAEDFSARSEPGLIRAYYAPLLNFAATPYWYEVNYLSNAVARSESLNRGAWFGLEWAVRNLVNRRPELFIVTGPVYRERSDQQQLRTEKLHSVPDAFFKVVLTAGGEAAAFVLPQEVSVGVHHCELRSHVAEIEKLTGLVLFPERDLPLQESLAPSLGCP